LDISFGAHTSEIRIYLLQNPCRVGIPGTGTLLNADIAAVMRRRGPGVTCSIWKAN